MTKKIIIVGAGGQDGKILARKLEDSGDSVFKIFSKLKCNDDINISDYRQVCNLIKNYQPDEIYYLAAYHSSSEENIDADLSISYGISSKVHVEYYLNFLSAIKSYSLKTKIFYAASSLVFSGKNGRFQNESTPFDPLEIYGLTKVQGIHISNYFRQVHGVFASVGILYSHESCYRKNNFLSAKIIKSAMNIAAGNPETLTVGNLDAEVDWSYAHDFVDAFQLILGAEKSDNFIVASGEAHTVREFIEAVFSFFNINYKKYVVEDKCLLFRTPLIKIGDISKIKSTLNWQPKRSFKDFIKDLIIDYKNIN